MVAAQDERAKKLERDIHDGAQQQLVALAVKQRIAASLVGKDEEKLRAMLEGLQAETTQDRQAAPVPGRGSGVRVRAAA